MTQLSEDATPIDVVSTHGESATPAASAPATSTTPGTPSTANAATVDDGAPDALTLEIAIAAAVLATVAVGLSPRRGA